MVKKKKERKTRAFCWLFFFFFYLGTFFDKFIPFFTLFTLLYSFYQFMVKLFTFSNHWELNMRFSGLFFPFGHNFLYFFFLYTSPAMPTPWTLGLFLNIFNNLKSSGILCHQNNTYLTHIFRLVD